MTENEGRVSLGPTATLDTHGNARRLVVHTASTQPADLTRDDPGDRPIGRTDMDASPTARRPRLNTFTRLARFSTPTGRWHSIDRASGQRGDVTDDDIPHGETVITRCGSRADLPAVVPPTRAGDDG